MHKTMEKLFHYKNPIIPGFHPDPSICRAENRYYLVCSSFQYFPGIPLFESSDLVNWRQIGHVLTRPSQLPLQGADSSGGIYAPTIRFYKGRFYVTATNVSGMGNFIVWTDNIYGEWSDPVSIDQDGIDPSLYFENDDVYFMSNHNEEDGTASIIQCSIDPFTGKKLTESRSIWKGCGGRYLEGPHLYKIGSWYYLMGAEGGTEYGHMEVLSRGVTPYGPFQNAPGNPIVTNRDLGGYPLQGTGHGDLVEDLFGNWWMVLLAFRQTGPYLPFHHLGRETCLIPVHFTEDSWLEAGTEGKVLLDIKTSRPLECSRQTEIFSLTFRNTKPGNEWVWLCNPSLPDYDFSRWESEEPVFRLKGNGYPLSAHGVSPSFLGLRQQEMEGTVQVQVRLSRKGEAGIALYMDDQHHYDFGLKKTDSSLAVIKRRTVGDMTFIQQSETLDPGIEEAVLSVTMTAENYFFTLSAGSRKLSFGQAKTRYLSSEVAGGFTGVMIGLYAFGTEEWAEFSCFEYRPVRSKDF